MARPTPPCDTRVTMYEGCVPSCQGGIVGGSLNWRELAGNGGSWREMAVHGSWRDVLGPTPQCDARLTMGVLSPHSLAGLLVVD